MNLQGNDEKFMQRCIDLALKGTKAIKSNPNVGSVIVHDDQIIGEGYHQIYGNHHAEVNALNSVHRENKKLFPDSTMYVSLEPCNHQGKTPPCTSAIIESGIKKVVIGSTDPNPKMMGKSVELLKRSGIDTKIGVLSNQTDQIIRRFKANNNGIPFITIKFAQTADFYISKPGKQVQISNEVSSIFTHKLRSENEAILIGTNTALIDNPSLTTRNYPGDHPIRVVLDRNQSLPKDLALFQDQHETIVLTSSLVYSLEGDQKEIIHIENWELITVLKKLYNIGVHSILVEGGAKIIKWFVKEGLWHDAYIITNKNTKFQEGVRAPRIKGTVHKRLDFGTDSVVQIVNI